MLIFANSRKDANDLGIADNYKQSAYLFLSLKHLHRDSAIFFAE